MKRLELPATRLERGNPAPLPCRIQLRRAKGWRLPEGAVSVARPARWGNPFALRRPVGRTDPLRPYLEAGVHDVTRGWLDLTASHHDVLYAATRAVAVAAYRAWLADKPGLIAEIRQRLRGKSLACWCPPDEPCHADVLLEVANG